MISTVFWSQKFFKKRIFREILCTFWDNGAISGVYSAWSTLNPDNYLNNQHCLATNWNNGWDDVDCERQEYFACDKRKLTMTKYLSKLISFLHILNKDKWNINSSF